MLTIKCIVTGLFQENTYLILNDETDSALIIDPGDDEEAIFLSLDTISQEPEAILCTHSHLDHIAAAAKLQKCFDLPFYLQQQEKVIFDDFPQACERWGFPKPKYLPKVTNWLNGDEQLQFKTGNLEVFFTPGHSAGGCSYKLGVHLFSGDTLFAGSIGRTDLPTGDYDILLNSIYTKLFTLPESTIVHCGHGVDTTIGQEKQYNPFLQGGMAV